MYRQKHKQLLVFFVPIITIAVITGVLVALPGRETYGRDNSIPAEHIHIEQFRAPSSGRFFSAAAAAEQLTIPDGQQSHTFTTNAYTPEINMNAIGVKLTGANLDVEIVAHIDGRKKDITRVLPPLHEDVKEPTPDGMFITKPVIVDDVKRFTLELTLNRLPNGSSPVIEDVEIIYLDSSRGTLFSAASTHASAKSGKLNVITRNEWGADEGYRLDSDGDAIWPVAYKDPKVFIVHHTAGTDGGDDPAATVRAVYYWHAMVLGWGDIGYNYLIDPAGNIYKGRKGKTGVIGGHTYNDIDNVNYNEGSIGIALLGCFEDTPGACYSQYEMTPEMEAALAKLIGSKAAKLEIKPKSKTALKGTETKRVAGHRDLDYTYCPGSDLYADLYAIRKKAQRQYEVFSLEPWAAEFVDATVTHPDEGEELDVEALEAGTPYQVTVQYKNTGRYTWKQSKLKLKVYNGTGKKKTSLAHKSWGDIYGKTQMNEELVAPGETATFTFLIKSPSKPVVRNIVTKLFHGKSKVKRSNATSTFTFVRTYAGELVEHTLPVAMFAGSEQEATFTFTNVGELAWEDNVVVTVNGEEAGSFNKTILTGETATAAVKFTAPSPKKSGKVKTFIVQLERDGARISGTRTVLVARIDK